MSQPKSLVKRAVALVLGFNPITQTVSSFADDELGREDEDAPADAVFLRQVLYGCVRYKEALKIFLSHLFADLAASIERNDYTLYMVLAFLLLFRLDELGFAAFRTLTAEQDPTKMCALLQYVTNWQRMEGQLTQDWRTVYDLKYINDVMLGGLKRSADDIAACCAKLELRAYGMARAKAEASAKVADVKPLTVVKPFNLTKPNPRKVRDSKVLQHFCDAVCIASFRSVGVTTVNDQYMLATVSVSQVHLALMLLHV
jgi:hypothetical protein